MQKNNSDETSKKKIKLKRMGKKKSNSEENSKPKKKKKVGKIIWLIFKIFIFTAIAAAIVGAGVVLGVLNDIITDTETLDTAQLKLLKLTTVIYDKNGDEIDSLSEENRYMVSYDDMPKYLRDAVVSIEDERFETHGGIDIKRTGKAVIEYVLNGGDSSFGGSTITQQLVKNITKDEDRAWQRKIREWYRAITLEKELNKSQILEAYLNTIYMGEGAYGVQAASNTLFAKDVKELNLAESACLAAIIQAPETYNPYNGDSNKESLIERQKLVLSKMLQLNKITQEEHDEALTAELVFKKGELAASAAATTYYVDAVIEAVIKDLMETKNITEGVATKMLYSDGLKIYTTLDPKVQAAIDKAYTNDSWFPVKNGKKMQSAMVVLDNATGYVVGLMGGTDYREKTGTSTFNRATQMKRQSGSSIKPLTVYGPAFELGKSYPGKGYDDSYISINGWAPRNFGGGYEGYVSTRYAIAISLNTIAVKTLQEVGLDYSYTFAKNLGLSTLTSADKNLAALALGGFSEGVKVIDMAGAYATIANGGVYIKPQFYTKVLDSEDNEILKAETEYKRVMKKTTAYLLTDCMRSVVTSGTAAGYIGVKSSIPVIGKTGTTDDAIDKWFCGMTPYYTGVVWIGYDDNKASVNNTAQMYVWNAVMKEVHSSLSGKSFEKPSGLVYAQVCTLSGLAATDACKADPRSGVVKSELFASGTVPTDTCNVHVTAEVCSVSGKLVTEFCHLYEDVEVKEQSFITRASEPKIKPGDWKYMLTDKTEKCDVHTEEPVVEEPENPEDVPGENPGTELVPNPVPNPNPGIYTE
ncbi:MAG: PBP1A family penicillin-binding protein [Clostridia bacterium]|nr:PBP1A family penicillin-binding protein [Clostridia bacterium]